MDEPRWMWRSLVVDLLMLIAAHVGVGDETLCRLQTRRQQIWRVLRIEPDQVFEEERDSW